VDADVVAYFNSFWTYTALQNRRIEFLLEILTTLGFDLCEDEFGIEFDQEVVRQEIREKTDKEFENVFRSDFSELLRTPICPLTRYKINNISRYQCHYIQSKKTQGQ
jgi:hypothetical protein